MAIKQKANAVAYFRTSSDTNIGAGKDTLQRQREAVARLVFLPYGGCDSPCLMPYTGGVF